MYSLLVTSVFCLEQDSAEQVKIVSDVSERRGILQCTICALTYTTLRYTNNCSTVHCTRLHYTTLQATYCAFTAKTKNTKVALFAEPYLLLLRHSAVQNAMRRRKTQLQARTKASLRTIVHMWCVCWCTVHEKTACVIILSPLIIKDQTGLT
jgi:hypothetical protein